MRSEVARQTKSAGDTARSDNRSWLAASMTLCRASILSICLAACATPTSGVLPAGEGAYVVTHQGSSALVTTADLKAAALREASAYCEQQGKRIKIIHTKEVQARPFGGWPEAEVVFNCS